MTYKIEQLDYETFNGSAYLQVDVEGFWSNPISIYVYCIDDEQDVEIRVEHSSGGYSSFETQTQKLQAERNFAQACLAACDYAEELLNNQQAIKDARNAYFKHIIDLREKEVSGRQARIDADTVVTEEQFDSIMKEIETFSAENNWSRSMEIFMKLRKRGSGYQYTASAVFGARKSFKLSFERTSQQKLKEFALTCADIQVVYPDKPKWVN